MRVPGYLVITIMLSMPTGMCSADQNDERLDTLFTDLHSLENSSDAARLTNEIWTIWHITDNIKAADKLESGIRAMREQQLEFAVAAFSDVIELAPDFAEGWNKRATAYYMMGEHADSAHDVKRTLELEPRHFGALAGLGLLYMAQEEYTAASKAFEAALNANPHLPGPKQNLKIIQKLIEKNQQSPGSTKI